MGKIHLTIWNENVHERAEGEFGDHVRATKSPRRGSARSIRTASTTPSGTSWRPTTLK